MSEVLVRETQIKLALERIQNLMTWTQYMQRFMLKTRNLEGKRS